MRIGNYIFYPAFFVLFVFLPILSISIIYCLYQKRQEKKHLKLNYIKTEYAEIVKEYLVECKYKEELLYYLENNKEFVPEATLQYGDDFVSVVTKDLFVLFLAFLDKDITIATYILLLIDSLNCELEYEGSEVNWIGDDVEREMFFISMDDTQAKLENIYLSSMTNKYEFMIEDTDYIGNTNIYCKLKEYSAYEVEKYINDLVEYKSMYNLEETLIDFISYCLIDDINNFLNSFETGLLNSIRIYKVRALACVLNNKPYDVILLKNTKKEYTITASNEGCENDKDVE